MEISTVGQNSVLPAAVTPTPAEHLAENREVIQAVKAINASELLGDSNELTFSVDRDTRRLVLRIVNPKTKEVVRQVPPEYVLRIAEELKKQTSE